MIETMLLVGVQMYTQSYLIDTLVLLKGYSFIFESIMGIGQIPYLCPQTFHISVTMGHMCLNAVPFLKHWYYLNERKGLFLFLKGTSNVLTVVLLLYQHSHWLVTRIPLHTASDLPLQTALALPSLLCNYK